MPEALQIDAQFPGGNIVVEAIDGDLVRLHQDLRDTERDWFYWYFRVRGAAGRTLRFEFTQSQAIGTRGPAVSTDAGMSWAWLGQQAVEANAFCCTFDDAPDEVRFSFGMPYQPSRWQEFIALAQEQCGHRESLQQHVLCTSDRGHTIDYFLVGCNDRESQHRVAITCRHHCCEMMASYALEGLVDWMVRDPGRQARWLRSSTQLLVVPFVDLDGVEAGDQGKGRRPRDHGRDYAGDSLYATTAAIRQRLPDFSDGALRLCLDLHCPWISGPRNEVIFLVGSADQAMAAQQVSFSEILARESTGPLPVSAGDFLPFGTSWNTDDNHTEGIGFSGWASSLPHVKLATAVEVPYATASGAEVNQVTARRFGADLGKALATYLLNLPA